MLSATVSAQDAVAKDEIPIERCGTLPVVKVHVAGKDMHFLVDTAATTLLNLKSFAGGRSKEVNIAGPDCRREGSQDLGSRRHRIVAAPPSWSR